MADGKWINELSPATPLEDAARRVLTVRFDVVLEYLPLALHKAAEDPEHVHQLRVATRRARAALDIFERCLPGKAYRAAKKRLRRIRRAAGGARDWDVFLEQLTSQEKVPSRHRAGLDLLIGHALGQRAMAQATLDAHAQDEQPFEFKRAAAQTVAAVQSAEPAEGAEDAEGAENANLRTLLDLARPTLARLTGALTRAATGAAVGAAAGDLDDYAHLHQVRIIGKRLRYAMEVFADCFEPSFREELYPAVEEMQDILGLANDSHVAAGRLDGILKRVDRLPERQAKRFTPGITALRKQHAKRLEQQVATFQEWWGRWQALSRSSLHFD